MADIDTQYLDSDTDKIKPARSAIFDTAQRVNIIGAELHLIDILIKDRGYSPLTFGADPDGADDSTTAFTAAATALLADKGGGEIDIGPGEFLLLDLPIVSGVRWVGRGKGSTLLRKNAGVNGTFIAQATGTVGATSALASNASAGSFQVTVSNAASWSVGDWALIRENTYVSGAAGRKQQILRVTGKSSNTLTFAQPLFESYTTAASAELCVLGAITNAGIYDVLMEGVNGSNGGGCVKALYAIGLELDEVHTRYFSGNAGISFGTCYDSHVRFCSARDGVGNSTSGQGYGIEFDEATAFSSVQDCYVENVRETTFTNRTTHSKFMRNKMVGNYDNGFNTHGALVSHCDIDDNDVIGTSGAAGNGLVIGFGSHTAGDTDIRMRRNRISYPGAWGVVANAPSSKENLRIELSDNTIFHPMAQTASGSGGVLVQRAIGIKSRNNLVQGNSNPNSGTGFYVLSTTDGDFNGDAVRNLTGIGFRYDTCSDVDFTDVVSIGVSGNNFRGDGTNTRVFVNHKRVDDLSVTLGAGSNIAGRAQKGVTAVTFSAQSSKTQTITFPAAYPTGVVPTVTGSPQNAVGAWTHMISNITNTGFDVTINDYSGASRTGSVNFYWIATE